MWKSTEVSLLRDGMKITHSRIQNGAPSLPLHPPGKDGKSSGPGHRAGASGSLPCPREHEIPVLSSYPVRYPEQATPTKLVTPIPLVKQTEFPHQDTRNPLPTADKRRLLPLGCMTVPWVPPKLVGAPWPSLRGWSSRGGSGGNRRHGNTCTVVLHFQFWMCFYALVHSKNEKSMRVRTRKTLVLCPHS